jgi:hypothetical protein
MSYRSNGPYCPHCANLNRYSNSVDKLPTNHYLRKTGDPSSPVTCPVLKKTQCQICYEFGHTRSYCVTPLKIYNGTPEGCLNRDLRATLPINELKGKSLRISNSELLCKKMIYSRKPDSTVVSQVITSQDKNSNNMFSKLSESDDESSDCIDDQPVYDTEVQFRPRSPDYPPPPDYAFN